MVQSFRRDSDQAAAKTPRRRPASSAADPGATSIWWRFAAATLFAAMVTGFISMLGTEAQPPAARAAAGQIGAVEASPVQTDQVQTGPVQTARAERLR